MEEKFNINEMLDTLDLDKYLWMVISTFGYLYSFDCTQGCTWDTVFGIWYSVLVCGVFGIWDNVSGINLVTAG